MYNFSAGAVVYQTKLLPQAGQANKMYGSGVTILASMVAVGASDGVGG